jgi:hypothetical protein
MDVPQTETDAQLTGLKVDDLGNSIRSKTRSFFAVRVAIILQKPGG